MLFTEELTLSVFKRVVAPKPAQTSSPVLLSPDADVLRGSSRVPAPLLSHCSQISAGDHNRRC